MKISKLFHWLYGALMLLPIFAVGVMCLYPVFNDNAKDSYSDYYVETQTAVTSADLEQVNNQYSLNFATFLEFAGINYYRVGTGYFNISNLSISWNDIILSNYQLTPTEEASVVGFQIATGGGSLILTLMNGNSERVKQLYYYPGHVNNHLRNLENTIYFTLESLGTFNLGSYQSTYSSNSMYLIEKTLGTLDNVFYYSIDKVRDMPIFSWANDSFVKTPIEYLTGLFGMANNNPILTIMSYWLSISIIWLMFDIVMYIPLLVHRLIDKGMVD